MKEYRILLSNKWGEEDEQNTMMGYQEFKYLHHHHKKLKEKYYGYNY
jgi:hypothetical protein